MLIAIEFVRSKRSAEIQFFSFLQLDVLVAAIDLGLTIVNCYMSAWSGRKFVRAALFQPNCRSAIQHTNVGIFEYLCRFHHRASTGNSTSVSVSRVEAMRISLVLPTRRKTPGVSRTSAFPSFVLRI